MSAATAALQAAAKHIAHPTFIAYKPAHDTAGTVTPFSTTSPTGLTPAQMRHAYGVDQVVLGVASDIADAAQEPAQ